ncbi:5682_t:CDS:1, partial [Racocetra persica]
PNQRHQSNQRPRNPDIVCFNCNKKGHIARNCTLPKNNQAQKYEYNENSQPKKVNYCEATEEIDDNDVWVEELYNMDQPITEK